MRTVFLAALVSVSLTACDNSGPGPGATLAIDDRDPSVARLWNEALLESIRNDFARPTVHARNLWHISAAMYDAWAAYDDTASTWLLGKTQNDYLCGYTQPALPRDTHLARERAISYAAYRLIRHRFENSPGAAEVEEIADALMEDLGFDVSITSSAYQFGSAAALGNYIADCYIAYGLQDGSNEANNYAATVYMPFNSPIAVADPGNPAALEPGFDLNRWQQIQLEVSVDQSGNTVESTPPFVSPEWGVVHPFSLTALEQSTCQRTGFDFPVYFDPGSPPTHDGALFEEFKWTHSLVAIWSSQLDPDSGRGADLIDISPNSIGNIQTYPTSFTEHEGFYDLLMGGTPDTGYAVNPATGLPYDVQEVPLADYARVIAEFWADGPDSETPPGHWFVIANTVSDHPQLVKRFEGAGAELGPLEWDVKLYFALGGAMHDAAITAWGIKGCYDYIRPVSAIRAMAELGQSSDTMLPNYHVDGIELVPNYIEQVQLGDMIYKPDLNGSCTDPVAATAEDVDKIKLYAWRGPCAVSNPNFDHAGVGWILAENWWPYQRPTFVTPPFAGYISGHSTYSRTAAELMTLFTGDEYFPGGKSEFPAPQNDFLVFENGPSEDLVLEWATYTDASDQCSLSRIWGGIHPPADDIPGRLIGMQLGPQAFEQARGYFTGVN